MDVTNTKKEGALGFFHADDPVTGVLIEPGQTVEVRGFNPDVKAHAGLLKAGDISLSASDMKRWQDQRDAERRAEDAKEEARLKAIADDEATAKKAADDAATEAKKAAKAGQSPGQGGGAAT